MRLLEKWLYGLGSVGNNIIYGLVTTYLMFFYTDYFGIGAAAVGMIFFFARIWDAINDTFMGIVVDNTQTRFGKFRPYLLFVPPIMAVTTVLAFSAPNLSVQGKVIYATITYVLWGMSFTAMDIPYWSLTAAITQDPNERATVVMIPRTLATVANILVVVVALPMVGLLGGGNDMAGWQRLAMLFGFISICLTWTTFFNVKERVHVKNKEPQTMVNYIKQLKENRPLRFIVITMLLYELVFTFKMAFMNYYIKYNFNAIDLLPYVMLCIAVGSIIGSVLAPYFGKKIGKKKLISIGMVGVALLGTILYFVGYNSLIAVIAINSVIAIFDGANLIMFYTLLTNTVEYGQYKTGERREGVVFSINIFKTKMAGAIGGAIGALALASLGFMANVEQTKFVLDGMHIFFTLIPSLLVLLALVPLRKYDLSDEKYFEILEELKLQANEGQE